LRCRYAILFKSIFSHLHEGLCCVEPAILFHAELILSFSGARLAMAPN
jgi:hypothetical protein